jgi:SAM-dependent methyltransferase
LLDIPEEISLGSFGCANPLTHASLREGERVLDLGSGGGLDCFLAARQVGPTGQVIGVDMTDEMLDLATRNSRRLGFEHVEFRRGTIESIPVDDQSVDVVLSNCVINLSPDKPEVFAEIFRVLAPGGRVSLADIVTLGPLSSEYLDQRDSWAACVAGALTVDDYAQGLARVGFTDVSVRPADGSDWRNVLHGHPISALITGRKPARNGFPSEGPGAG